ncbi:MAG: FkbM family methyltransferase [Nevskiales bacterium]|nr:FkbM family methyltransferase [Nevskiales bacterium]
MIIPRVVKTKYLFLNLLSFLKPSVVLDIGSMDGADSLRFRRMFPDAVICAFEANPHLYRAMLDDPALVRAKIHVVNKAVSLMPGMIKFYVSKEALASGISGNRGTSSTMQRFDTRAVAEEIEVPTIRLDDALGQFAGRSALWIDVEGAGHEVLSTVAASSEKVDAIYIETELRPQWKNQRLKDEVIALAESLDFLLVGHSIHPDQQDLVFVNRRTLNEHRTAVRAALLLTRIHGPISSRFLETIN